MLKPGPSAITLRGLCPGEWLNRASSASTNRVTPSAGAWGWGEGSLALLIIPSFLMQGLQVPSFLRVLELGMVSEVRTALRRQSSCGHLHLGLPGSQNWDRNELPHLRYVATLYLGTHMTKSRRKQARQYPWPNSFTFFGSLKSFIANCGYNFSINLKENIDAIHWISDVNVPLSRHHPYHHILNKASVSVFRLYQTNILWIKTNSSNTHVWLQTFQTSTEYWLCILGPLTFPHWCFPYQIRCIKVAEHWKSRAGRTRTISQSPSGWFNMLFHTSP